MVKRLTIGILLCMAAVMSAQSTTNFALSTPYNCGVFASPERCFYLPVTALDANGSPTGATGTITISYKPGGYPVGSPAGYGYRTIEDFGYIAFNGDFEGLGDVVNPNLPYPYNAAIVGASSTTGVNSGTLDLLFQGTDDFGIKYIGALMIAYTTHYACSGGRGGGGCHTSWTITSGSLSVTRSDY